MVKPVAGVLDLTSRTLEGIRNTTTVFDAKRERARVPRSFGSNGELRAYSTGAEILRFLQFHGDRYVSMARLEEARTAIVSSRRVLCVEGSGSRAVWQVPLHDIAAVSAQDNTVTMHMASGARSQQSGMATRVLRCGSAAAAAKLAEEIQRTRGAASQHVSPAVTPSLGLPPPGAAAAAAATTTTAGAAPSAMGHIGTERMRMQ